MAAKKKADTALIEVSEITMDTAQFCVLGKTPMIMNRFAQKAWQELLLPKVRESRATLESKLKHDPVAEFRGGIYLNRDIKAPTLVHLPNGSFHRAIAQAGVDMPGAARSKLERLTGVVEVNINLYGAPQLMMAMVRNSDMGRTPDVRTRPVFPEWACTVTIRWVRQLIQHRTIANLFGAAGVIVGIGDWRPQKGGSFGTFEIVSPDDARFREIVKRQARSAQQAAYDKPTCFDQDSEDLLAWYREELIRREITAPSSGKATKAKTKTKANGMPKTKRGIIDEDNQGAIIN